FPLQHFEYGYSCRAGRLAVIIGKSALIQKADDDGEPAGTASMGTPAVPDGSPSAFPFCIGALSPIIEALLLCGASLCLFLISEIKALASSSVSVLFIYPMNLDLFMTVSSVFV